MDAPPSPRPYPYPYPNPYPSPLTPNLPLPLPHPSPYSYPLTLTRWMGFAMDATMATLRDGIAAGDFSALQVDVVDVVEARVVRNKSSVASSHQC